MKFAVLAIAMFVTAILNAQPHCIDVAFDTQVRKYVKGSVPLIDVDMLVSEANNVLILDAREKEEYDISHIPGAKYIGHKKTDFSVLDGIPHDTRIVVYCSIGYRSEIIGKRITGKGYRNVENLFGSIFEWVNRGHPLENADGEIVTMLHAYSKAWSRWVLNPRITTVW